MLTLFEVLADPTRRGILELLNQRDRSVLQLVERFTLTQPAISRQLRLLREAGLVDVRPAGQRRVYSLRREPLEELETWLTQFRFEPGDGGAAT